MSLESFTVEWEVREGVMGDITAEKGVSCAVFAATPEKNILIHNT